ncbi:MAG: hypothetical protein QOG33_540 [Gaiellales bacterium]|jgi:hypothetical protein|nr:hypothetical protein [Gaiellales bacterium]
MRRSLFARVFGVAGLSAVSAAVAHAGPSGLADARFLTAAMVGALLTASALVLVGVRVLDLRARLDRIADGDLAAGVGEWQPRISLPVLVAVSLVCQGGAHAGLLIGGVHAPSGAVAAPTLHLLLGLLSALAVYAAERLLGRLASTVAGAVHAALMLLLALAGAPSTRPLEAPRSRATRTALRGRAPPVFA